MKKKIRQKKWKKIIGWKMKKKRLKEKKKSNIFVGKKIKP